MRAWAKRIERWPVSIRLTKNTIPGWSGSKWLLSTILFVLIRDLLNWCGRSGCRCNFTGLRGVEAGGCLVQVVFQIFIRNGVDDRRRAPILRDDDIFALGLFEVLRELVFDFIQRNDFHAFFSCWYCARAMLRSRFCGLRRKLRLSTRPRPRRSKRETHPHATGTAGRPRRRVF